ncbi:MAG: hypothetical protein FJ096_00070 [Deltaproteobacteria bacterium]|nr:hypothetical protein [Deltaproteobacteria bacterium]
MNRNQPPPQTPDMLRDDALLMQLADGELDPETEAAVLAQLEGSLAAQRKLASLEALGAFVKETTEGDARADGIVDAVMAAIEADEAQAAGDDSREPASQEPSVAAPRRDVPRARPANDNARSIFAIAGLAAAAAAALFLWSKTEPEEPTFAAAPLPEAPLVAPLAAKLDGSAAPTTNTPTNAAEPEAGVEVASVEFGSNQGSVFYVPGDGAATAVVWINDGGEDP